METVPGPEPANSDQFAKKFGSGPPHSALSRGVVGWVAFLGGPFGPRVSVLVRGLSNYTTYTSNKHAQKLLQEQATTRIINICVSFLILQVRPFSTCTLPCTLDRRGRAAKATHTLQLPF